MNRRQAQLQAAGGAEFSERRLRSTRIFELSEMSMARGKSKLSCQNRTNERRASLDEEGGSAQNRNSSSR